MSDDAVDLLDEAVATLRGQLASQVTGEARYLSLLSANAIATAAREWRMADRMLDEAEIDIAAIRAGDHDEDADLYAELCKRQAIRAWIADPTTLSPTDRERYLGDCQ